MMYSGKMRCGIVTIVEKHGKDMKTIAEECLELIHTNVMDDPVHHAPRDRFNANYGNSSGYKNKDDTAYSESDYSGGLQLDSGGDSFWR